MRLAQPVVPAVTLTQIRALLLLAVLFEAAARAALAVLRSYQPAGALSLLESSVVSLLAQPGDYLPLQCLHS
jgi:hypothetical protein